jgi:hypothetical protein
VRKWRTVIIVWIGILLYFGIGSYNPRETDLFLNILYVVLLLAATVYTLVIWLRDLAKGGPEKSYHLAAYPRWLRRFAFDEREPEQGRRVERRSAQEQESDPDRT